MLLVIRYVWRTIQRQRAARTLAVQKMPKAGAVKRGTARVPVNWFILRYPTWRYPNRDGTADRRRRSNPMVLKQSELHLPGFVLRSNNPFALYPLVREARYNGSSIAVSTQEQQKLSTLQSQIQNRRTLNSAAELVRRFGSTPTDFEHYCANLFRQFGYRVQVTPPARDGGIDLRLEKDSRRYIAECKCYGTSSLVGRGVLQKLYGGLSEKRCVRYA